MDSHCEFDSSENSFNKEDQAMDKSYDPKILQKIQQELQRYNTLCKGKVNFITSAMDELKENITL